MNAPHPDRWCETSVVPMLEPGEIHVWKIHLAAPAAAIQLEKFLSAEERERAARFHFAADKNRFITCRAVLRQLLAAQVGATPDALRFESRPHGKPVVSGQKNAAGLHFNCSHSADWGLVALARDGEVGVDLEQHRHHTDVGALAERFFSAAEIGALKTLPEALKTMGFFNAWTRKEAFVKALGLGLAFPLNGFSVTLAPGQPAALLDVVGDPEAVRKWTLAALDVRPDYSAALVFAGHGSRLKHFHWQPPIT